MSLKMTHNHQVVNGSPYLTGSFVDSRTLGVRSCPYSWRTLSIRNQQVAGSNPAGGSKNLFSPKGFIAQREIECLPRWAGIGKI